MRAFFRRNRRLAAVLAAMLLAFELWRLWEALPYLAPFWTMYGDMLSETVSGPLWLAVLTLTISAMAFALQMALAVWLFRLARRKLFRRMDSLTPAE